MVFDSSSYLMLDPLFLSLNPGHGDRKRHCDTALLIATNRECSSVCVQHACENVIARFSCSARTVTLYRPVGPKELELIAAKEWREFPPRLPGQPIFYPVTNEAYAAQIARDWSVKSDGAGFVTKFDVDAYYRHQISSQHRTCSNAQSSSKLSLRQLTASAKTVRNGAASSV